MRSSPQPSTRAASRYSSGIVRKNWRSRKIENASPNQFGMISGPSAADEAQLRPHDVERHDRHLAAAASARSARSRRRDVAAAPADAATAHTRPGMLETSTPSVARHGVDHRVQGPAPDRRLVEDVDEVLPAERMRPELSRTAPGSLVISDGQRDEHERRQEGDGRGDEQAVVRRPRAGSAAGASAAGRLSPRAGAAPR